MSLRSSLAARNRELHRVVELGERADQDVESLAGHEPAEPENERSLGIDAVLRAHCGPFGRVDRVEPLRIDTRGNHHVRDRSAGRTDARVAG